MNKIASTSYDKQYVPSSSRWYWRASTFVCAASDGRAIFVRSPRRQNKLDAWPSTCAVCGHDRRPRHPAAFTRRAWRAHAAHASAHAAAAARAGSASAATVISGTSCSSSSGRSCTGPAPCSACTPWCTASRSSRRARSSCTARPRSRPARSGPTCDCGRPCRQRALQERRGAWKHRCVAYRGAWMNRSQGGVSSARVARGRRGAVGRAEGRAVGGAVGRAVGRAVGWCAGRWARATSKGAHRGWSPLAGCPGSTLVLWALA
mmetsp:Transcript_21615/g.54973  ORF Transcript_21615/g.54973 Transcript_21615/m.54973 type:complete len:262 (-) Transcript_21615:119-904(-)